MIGWVIMVVGRVFSRFRGDSSQFCGLLSARLRDYYNPTAEPFLVSDSKLLRNDHVNVNVSSSHSNFITFGVRANLISGFT